MLRGFRAGRHALGQMLSCSNFVHFCFNGDIIVTVFMVVYDETFDEGNKIDVYSVATVMEVALCLLETKEISEWCFNYLTLWGG